MQTKTWRLAGLLACMLPILVAGIAGASAQVIDVFHATLDERNAKTPEVSTADVQKALAEGSAIVLDSRKRAEYVNGHIAGAKSVSPTGEAPPAAFAAAVEQLVSGDKSKALILYCNGAHCQASRQLADTLVAAGFTNVKRYQLGIPMWRTLSGALEIELEGVLRVYKLDKTAVFFDARTAEDFARGSLDGSHSVPADQLASDGLRKAPMPNNDFNTRIILFGRDGTQARTLADVIGKTPYQNVSYFPGRYEDLVAALNGK